METKISIVQFLFANNWKVLSDSLGANPALTSHSFQTSPEVMKFCATEQSCLIIANVASKDDLIQLATFVKSARRSLKNTILKIVVVNATENKQFEKAISKLGSVEIIEPSVSVKALRFKMDFWMKAMKGQAKKLGALNQKSMEASAAEAAPEIKSLIQNPPLECDSDIWLLTRDSDCKRIIGRWMVKLMGPSPYVGQWMEIPNKQDIWSFTIKQAFAEQFVNGSGSWFFKGEQKPEYNWQENRWMFTGESFELFFSENGSSQSKVKLAAKVLTISGNSLFAKTKESLIIESFNKDFVFKQEAELLKGQSLEFENEGDLGGNLEGKLKGTEQKSKGQLEGKSKELEPKKSHLHGKIKDKEAPVGGHLEGEVKEQEVASSSLEGKVKEREVSLEGYLEGEVKEKEASKNDLHGKRKEKEASLEGYLEGEVKGKEASKNDLHGKLKDKEASLEGHLEGEIKKTEAVASGSRKKHEPVNEEIESKWKGQLGDRNAEGASESEDHKQHNEKLSNRWGGDLKDYTAEEKAERKRRELEAAARGPELRGKNDKTDHIEAHWGGKNSSDSVNNKGLSAPGVADVKEGSLLDLKKTDHEHQTHYKNHNKAAKFEAGELGKNKFKENDDGALGGKSSTDKLASHYGAGHSETDKLEKHLGRKNLERHPTGDEDEEQSSPSALSGKTKTDKIKGHYGAGKTRSDSSDELPSNPELEAISFDSSDVITDFEEVTDSPLSADLANVLPFPKPEEEKDIEKITANPSMQTYLIQDNKKHACKLDDFFDSNVIFICPEESFRISEKAQLDISLNYQLESARIYCEGIVMSVDDNGSGHYYVTVQVKTSDAQMFENFMELMKSRQENIQSFLMKARGL